MLNNCEFIGNIGGDPEIRPISKPRTTAKEDQTFTTFSIAVNKPGADKDDKPLWVNVTAFGKTGNVRWRLPQERSTGVRPRHP